MEIKKNLATSVVITTGLLFGSSAVWNVVQKGNLNSLNSAYDAETAKAAYLMAQKINLERQLDSVNAGINTTGVMALNLPSYNSTATLNNTEGSVKELVKDNNEIHLLKKENTSLKKLKAQNTKLANDNTLLLKNLKEQKAYYENLNANIASARQLKAYDISLVAYKLRWWNHKKEIPTKKACNTKRINVSFDIIENILAEQGTKQINVVIKDPNGMVLTDPDKNTSASTQAGTSSLFSAQREVEYHNSDLHVGVNFDHNLKLKKGKYMVELYADGKIMGQKAFLLH